MTKTTAFNELVLKVWQEELNGFFPPDRKRRGLLLPGLSTALEMADLHYYELAAKTGISERALLHYRQGTRGIRGIRKVLKIANVLNVGFEDLTTYENLTNYHNPENVHRFPASVYAPKALNRVSRFVNHLNFTSQIAESQRVYFENLLQQKDSYIQELEKEYARLKENSRDIQQERNKRIAELNKGKPKSRNIFTKVFG